MPFGKYKDAELADVPRWYLEWLIARPGIRDPLRSELEAELTARRAAGGEEVITLRLPRELAPIVSELVDRGLHSCAMKHHPDRPGGSVRQMQQLNLAANTLRAQLREFHV